MDIGRPLPADVTRDLLEELLVFKSLYEALARTVTDGVVELDAHGRIVRFNYAAETATGASATSQFGRDFADLLYDGDPSSVFAVSNDRDAHPQRLVLRDTRDHPVEVHARVTSLRRGSEIEGWIVSFAPMQKVQEIEQLKNELVSTVSHELKTPLAAIKAYTATLRANPGVYAERHDEYLGIIEQQADRLARLIDDMLLVSRVEAGQMLRRRVLVQLDDVIDRAVASVGYDPTRYHFVRTTVGARVSGDPERLYDIFRNLLENAVKYTPHGGMVSVSAHETSESTVVDVRDEGVGISDEHLPYIFDRFFRVDSDLASMVGGSGLGLFIVHALVRAHGGTIEVRSEPGQGSTFTVTLPLR